MKNDLNKISMIRISFCRYWWLKIDFVSKYIMLICLMIAISRTKDYRSSFFYFKHFLFILYPTCVHIFMCPKKHSRKKTHNFCPPRCRCRSWLTHMSSQFFASRLQHLSTLNFLASWGSERERVENQVSSGWKCFTFHSVSYIFFRHNAEKLCWGEKISSSRAIVVVDAALPAPKFYAFSQHLKKYGRDVNHEWKASTRRRILLIFQALFYHPPCFSSSFHCGISFIKLLLKYFVMKF